MLKKEISEIGAFLRRLRFENNESQEEMAVKLGVTAPYISLLEYRQPLTRKIAFSIIRAYGLNGSAKDSFVNMVTNDIVRRFWKK